MIGRAFEESRGKYDNPEMNTFREARVGSDRGIRCDTPVRANSISAELVDLREAITQAHELFSVLEDRTRMFRQPTPQCVDKEGVPMNGGSEIRANLADQNVRLRTLVSRIATMIDEIDV